MPEPVLMPAPVSTNRRLCRAMKSPSDASGRAAGTGSWAGREACTGRRTGGEAGKPGVADMLHEIDHMSAWRAAADSVVWRRRYIFVAAVEIRSAAPGSAKGTVVSSNGEQRDRTASGQGFIAALDQSGGSMPTALKL